MFNSSGVVKNEVAFLPRFENRGCGPPGRMARRHPTGNRCGFFTQPLTPSLKMEGELLGGL